LLFVVFVLAFSANHILQNTNNCLFETYNLGYI